MKQLIFLSFTLLTLTPLSAEETDLRRLMSTETFAASGLAKLTPAELSVLHAWIGAYCAGTAQVPDEATLEKAIEERVEARLAEEKNRLALEKKEETVTYFGLQDRKGDDVDTISSRIVGDFFGWSGSTVFVLENGQIWQQRQPGNYYKKMSNPEVIIEKRMLGYWMVVPSLKASCPVKRIR